MPLVLPVVGVLAGVWFLRLALSDRVKLDPAPGLGRVALVSLALLCFAIALSAPVGAFQGQLSPGWALRPYYGVTGAIAASACVATGLYTFVLAPGAYQRRHPGHPSEFWAEATEVVARASGIILVGLGLAAIVITGYLVVVAPGL